jgi:hypothetical protein
MNISKNPMMMNGKNGQQIPPQQRMLNPQINPQINSQINPQMNSQINLTSKSKNKSKSKLTTKKHDTSKFKTYKYISKTCYKSSTDCNST